jgi:SAM-dependent methyltransferase
MQASQRESPWFVQAFERIYLHVYPHRNDAEAQAHAGVLCDLLGVRPGGRVLDVGCGAGRHARALARRGLRVTGVDLSAELLEEAREQSPGVPGSPTYIRLDARNLPFRSQFEGAISMFTSFGYFEERADDLRLMEGVARALLPGGRFVVDYLNESAVRQGLEPVTDLVIGDLEVRMERRILEDGPAGPVVLKRVRATHRSTEAIEADYEERVRLYTADEVDALLAEAGFEPRGERFGDFDRSPFGPDAPRLVRVVQRGR